ncbi:MAG: 6-phosphogluconolactonase [Gammaproteobacteria bacterium]
MQNINWRTFATPDEIATEACRFILAEAETAIAERGEFKLVLAGGTTPEKVYQLLAQSSADWSNWHIYFGDERCLPDDHQDRNSVMASRALLDKVAIPAGQVHIMPTELGPEAAAEAYRKAVASAGSFDLALLGMGEDGHTASLFPGHVHREDESVHAVYDSPKPPPERISLSAKTLSASRRVLFLVTGAGKHDAVTQWRQGADLPVARIQCAQGVDVYIDTAALNGA